MSRKVSAVLLLVVIAGAAWSQQSARVARDMRDGARHFLAGLTETQQSAVSLPYDGESRHDWHYIPRERPGVAYRDMSPAQRKLATSLVATGLDPRGLRQAFDVMYLDHILFEMEGRPIRDPDAYYFTMFGEPSDTGAWAWRVEGHHLSLNFTLRDGSVVSAAPAFFGANPAVVRAGAHEGMRVLAEEELQGRALLHSFADRGEVLLDVDAPSDIVTGNSRRVDLGKPEGVAYVDMTSEQQRAVWQLIEHYARRLRSELAEEELSRIEESGREAIHFAWAGGAEAGQPHYYRLHGPTFLVEYDNTQNDANHIHTVWRDLEHDFGDFDALQSHYLESPHHHGEPRRAARE